jgi:acyl-CoA thioesterase
MPKKPPEVPRGYSPFLEYVGVTFDMAENGAARAVLQVDEKLLNSTRAVHGGATFTLVDCGMGGAVVASLGEGERVRTVETQIVYLRGAGTGKLICDAKVIHRGRRIAIVECEVKQRGQRVAKAIGTYSILRARSE